MSQPNLDMLWSRRFYVCKRNSQPLKQHEITLTVLLLHHFRFFNRAVYVTNPVGITSVSGLSQPILDMVWSEPFCIPNRYAWLFKLTEIALTVLVLHHLTFSNRTVNETDPVFITSVDYLSQPKLDMLWSVRFCVRKRIVKLIKCHEIALTGRLLHHFTLSTWAVYVINLVGITSVGGLSQSILDMLWSEPFCESIRYAQSFNHPKIDRTMLLLHHLTFSNRTVYMINPVHDKSSSYHFYRLIVAAYTWYALVSAVLCT